MFTDVEQWAPVVRAICRREGIPCQEIEAGYPGTNAVYVVDRRYVVKVYAPFCHDEYELECVLYPILAHDPEIPAPMLLAQGTWPDRIDWPYIVMEYLPGCPVREARHSISPSNHVGIGLQLGRLLRRLHATPLRSIPARNSLAALDRSGRAWCQLVRRHKSAFAQQFRRETALSPRVIDQCATWLELVWDDVLTDRLVLLNGDVTEDHVLVQRQNGMWRITGVIDFADALIGQAEYEWIALWFGALDRDGKAMRACLAEYDPAIPLTGVSDQPGGDSVRPDRSFVGRAMAFTLLHEFGAGIVRSVLEQVGNPPVRSFGDLVDVLWGNLIEEGMGDA
jgi:hygromycin-B 7''-O-kinase